MGLFALFNVGTEQDEELNKYSKAEDDQTSLGNILLEKGFVTEKVLGEAIKIQKSQSLLGRILVGMGPDRGGITEGQLREALLEQKILRKKARAREVIEANSKKHGQLVDEVQNQLLCIGRKYSAAGKG